MLSSLTTKGSHAALHAMSLGAADVLAKDTSQISLAITNLKDELIKRVKALAASALIRKQVRPAPLQTNEIPQFRAGQFDLVCIGSSTGGPPVLESLLASLPANFSTPVAVAQHMPELFTRSMSERLAGMCKIKVKHVEDRMPLERGHIYIARGGLHMHVEKLGLARWELRMSDEPKDAPYRPSVDTLLGTAATATGSRTLAIVLTGMGQDGLEGGRLLHQNKGTLLAQSAETCVVYGMPKAVTENGLVAASLAPEQISTCLATLSR
jgi:two-component system chemotaxis response regulator CheB